MYKRLLITNIPPEMDQDDLAVIFESNISPFKCEVEKISFIQNHSAIILFKSEFDKLIIPKNGIIEICNCKFNASAYDDHNEIQSKDINENCAFEEDKLLNLNDEVIRPVDMHDNDTIYEELIKKDNYKMLGCDTNQIIEEKISNINDFTMVDDNSIHLNCDHITSHSSNPDINHLSWNVLTKTDNGSDFKKKCVLNSGHYTFNEETYNFLKIIANKNNNKIGDIEEIFTFNDNDKIISWSSCKTVDEVKVDLLEYSNCFEKRNICRSITIDPDSLNILKVRPGFLDMLMKIVLNENILVFFYLQDNYIFAISFSESFQTISNILNKIFIKIEIHLENTYINLLTNNDIWTCFYEDLVMKYFLHIIINKDGITIVGVEKDVNEASGEIKKWIHVNGVVDLKINLKEIQYSLVTNIVNQKFSNIKNLKIDFNETDRGIYLKGPIEEIDNVQQFIDKTIDNIIYFQHKIKNSFLDMKLFENDFDGYSKLKDIESYYKCVIQIQDSEQLKSLGEWMTVNEFFNSMKKLLIKNMSDANINNNSQDDNNNIAMNTPKNTASYTNVSNITNLERNSVATSSPNITKAIDNSKNDLLYTIALRIKLNKISISDVKADVLVNVISNKSNDLNKVGVIGSIFLKAGGEDLQKNLNACEIPKKFGMLCKTIGTGNLGCKFVYHLVVGKNTDSKSIQLLEDALTNCIKSAIADNVKSIAFPAIGCGKLKFLPQDLCLCLIHAMKNNNSATNIEVYLVTPHDDQFTEFSKILKNVSSYINQTQKIQTSKVSDNSSMISTPKNKTSHLLDEHHRKLTFSRGKSLSEMGEAFDIYVLLENENQKNKICKQLDDICEALFLEKEITKSEFNIICPLISEKIDQNKFFGVYINLADDMLKICGYKAHVENLYKEILKLAEIEKCKLSDIPYLRRSLGSKALLKWISNTSNQYPFYWNDYIKDLTNIKENCLLDKNSNLYKEVTKIFLNTWDSKKMGGGADETGLTHRNVEISNITLNVNKILYDDYMSNIRKTCISALNSEFLNISKYNNEVEVQTKGISPFLDDHLISEINEYFLFHGTKLENVELLMNKGIDSRFSGEKVLFGTGTYFAETSTKSDQYSDIKNQRLPLTTKFKMIISRVLLGQIFLCTEPKNFKKEPCIICKSDRCQNLEKSHLSSNCVIGVNRNDKTRLKFREFVSYSNSFSYPEFLVEYFRKP